MFNVKVSSSKTNISVKSGTFAIQTELSIPLQLRSQRNEALVPFLKFGILIGYR